MVSPERTLSLKWKDTVPQTALPLKKRKVVSAVESVVLSALYYRDILLRQPYACEYATVFKLYLKDKTNLEKLKKLVESGLTLRTKKIHHMLFGTSLTNNGEISSLIHFDIRGDEEKICYIRSLHVKESYQQQGIATLLMNYAYAVAKQNQCKAIKLKTSDPARFCYIHLGFKPSLERIALADWHSLTFAQKVKCGHILAQTEGAMEFICGDTESEKHFQTQCQKVLAPDYVQNRQKRNTEEWPPQETQVTLPKFVATWDKFLAKLLAEEPASFYE